MTSTEISARDIVRVEAIINSLCICMEGPGGEDQAAARAGPMPSEGPARAESAHAHAECEEQVGNQPASEQKSEIERSKPKSEPRLWEIWWSAPETENLARVPRIPKNGRVPFLRSLSQKMKDVPSEITFFEKCVRSLFGFRVLFLGLSGSGQVGGIFQNLSWKSKI